MEFPWGFNETTIREMSRVALDTTYAPDGPGVRCLLRTKIPLLRYRLIGPCICIYMCIRIYISGSVAVLGGAERSLKRSVLYRTPEQGYWITVIFNYESTRILAKTGGAKPEPDRERGGGKKRKK